MSVSSSSDYISTNPVTGDVVWRGAHTAPDQVHAAVARARRAFGRWSCTAFDQREAILVRFKACVQEERTTLATLIAHETGKPFWEACTEVDSVAAKIDLSIKAYHERTGTKRTADGTGAHYVRHKPHGVLAVLGPYNFPVHLPNGHIIPALLAGNTVVFKPSEWTPACGIALCALLAKAGVPEDVVQCVPGGVHTGEALAAHPEIDGLLFTGSARVGRALHQHYGPMPHKILALEMGGNNPLLVWDCGDVAAAASLIVASAYVSAGQRCTCARRLIVPDTAFGAQVIEAVAALIDRLIVGGPFDTPEPFMGPVIHHAAQKALVAAQNALIAQGARPVRLMNSRGLPSPFLQPGLLDVTDTTRHDEELFGPLLHVVRVATLEAGLKEMNATCFGLAAGLVSDNPEVFEQVWQHSRAGIVNWNKPLTGAASHAPFGGIGMSGNHRPSAYYAADYSAFPVAGFEQAQLCAVPLRGVMP